MTYLSRTLGKVVSPYRDSKRFDIRCKANGGAAVQIEANDSFRRDRGGSCHAGGK